MGGEKCKKRRITESAVTPTYGGFRRDELDTVAVSARRIFSLKKRLFRDGPDQGHVHANENKKTKKRRSTKSTVTPTYGGFRRDDLDTVAGSARRIFLREGVGQGRFKTRQMHAK